MTDLLIPRNNNNELSFKPLPYDLPYMPDELKKRAKLELFEDENTRVQSLKLLKTMLTEEKNLRFQNEDAFLLTFLRARKFDVKKAFSLVKTFYSVLRKHRDLYDNFDYEDVKRILEENVVGFLPCRDEDGTLILVLRTDRWDPHKTSLGPYMKVLTTGLLHAIRSPATQVAGIKVIIDVRDFNYRYLPHVSPKYMWLFAEALQNCFPARFKGIHIVNEGNIVNTVWLITRPFLTKKLRERFHFHGKNLSSFLKHFNPQVLPLEYGGTEGNEPIFDNTEWANLMHQSPDYFVKVFAHAFLDSSKKTELN